VCPLSNLLLHLEDEACGSSNQQFLQVSGHQGGPRFRTLGSSLLSPPLAPAHALNQDLKEFHQTLAGRRRVLSKLGSLRASPAVSPMELLEAGANCYQTLMALGGWDRCISSTGAFRSCPSLPGRSGHGGCAHGDPCPVHQPNPGSLGASASGGTKP